MAVWGFVRREARGLGWGMLTVRSGAWPGDAHCEEQGLGRGMLVGIGIWQNGIFYALDFFRF